MGIEIEDTAGNRIANVVRTSFFASTGKEVNPVSIVTHITYALAWLGFGALHSLLAGAGAKDRLQPFTGGAYRLIYNLFAFIHIGIVIYGARYLIGEAPRVFALSTTAHLLLVGIMLLGVIIFVAALFQYDLGRFAGVTQLMHPDNNDTTEALQLAGLHRFVRHPLYTGAHLYLWGSVRTEFDLATAVWASCYLMIGSHFEEQKLIADYGERYRHYKKRVPSVIPWRGRAI